MFSKAGRRRGPRRQSTGGRRGRRARTTFRGEGVGEGLERFFGVLDVQVSGDHDREGLKGGTGDEGEGVGGEVGKRRRGMEADAQVTKLAGDEGEKGEDGVRPLEVFVVRHAVR